MIIMDCQYCETCLFSKADDTVYYEIHITVKYHPDFIGWCESAGIKCIELDLGGGVPVQLMTSVQDIWKTDLASRLHANILEKSMEISGFEVERVKIEVSPNHPEVGRGNYFEAHFAVINPAKEIDLSCLPILHKSRNLLKKGDDRIQMLTYRNVTSLPRFQRTVDGIERALIQQGHTVAKPILEYCLYDSNEALDNQWMGKKYSVVRNAFFIHGDEVIMSGLTEEEATKMCLELPELDSYTSYRVVLTENIRKY